ncbi:MAG: DNA mismatch repair endonuclease MutL, partial [Eubacteriales bacterium]|nr:DNA mismatch repair endonuclease MutL [Eubacteriales bacterium]
MDLTQRIRTLPKEISDKIAAGEVVERPLSIVKELLENAIDAGAASIVVEIQNGGKTYVRLTDNGCGIPARDAALVFQRYATSKITTAEDLASIQTLGFRGEALASIAAVSRVELITKTTQQKTGVKITVEGGNVTDMEETGAEDGTTIIVSDLFFNTPVRKKFLKPDRTESALIVDYLSKMAL